MNHRKMVQTLHIVKVLPMGLPRAFACWRPTMTTLKAMKKRAIVAKTKYPHLYEDATRAPTSPVTTITSSMRIV
jgi:hypothetical protein